MSDKDRTGRLCHRLMYRLTLTFLVLATGPLSGDIDGFVQETVVDGLDLPVTLAFLPDGRMLIVERRGLVHVFDNGVLLPTPFIDLIDEVGDVRDRGMLGLAVDPDFDQNGYVYFVYTVDQFKGQPDEPEDVRTFSRLTRYTADPKTGGNTVIPESRLVLIGEESDEGFPTCSPSHTIGTLRFGADDSLFVGSGDGAHFAFMDDGGNDAQCFEPFPFPGFSLDQDVGAFRSQYLDTYAGKILRIDPATGGGLPGNPYFTGDPHDIDSKIWVSGLRNPYRFNVRPDSPSPGTLYIGDVGWTKFEEINVAHGGENFGWPCYEGFDAQPDYWSEGEPDHSGCDTIETPPNPGPETKPLIWFHHSQPSESFPEGFTGRCAVGGSFYTKANYPSQVRGAFFFADCIDPWLKAVVVDPNDNFVRLEHVLTGLGVVVGVEADPGNGDVLIIEYIPGRIQRLRFPELDRTDFDNDGDTDIRDFAFFSSCFSGAGHTPVPGCLSADVDQDNDVDLDDFSIVKANLSGPF